MKDHDPTGHVVLSANNNTVCSICERGVEVAEWLATGRYRWRWEHIAPKETR